MTGQESRLCASQPRQPSSSTSGAGAAFGGLRELVSSLHRGPGTPDGEDLVNALDARLLRLSQALRLLRDTSGEYVGNVAQRALDEAGIPEPPEEDHPCYEGGTAFVVEPASRVLPMYDGPPVVSDDVVEVYVIFNGSHEMSPGKVAAQAFHTGWLYGRHLHVQGDAWQEQGRRVSVRIAETAHVFDRVLHECDGMLQRDEGLQEVERGAVTAFVSIPYRRADAPKILSHKRVQAYGR